MTKEIKFYIFGARECPLCLRNKALEFSTYKEAEDFLNYLCERDSLYTECYIKETVLFYDGGYINASNCLPFFYSDNGDVMLVNKITGVVEFI